MYGRKDKSPRLITPGFEHLNNFVLFDDGGDVFVKRIDNDESLTTNLVQYTKMPLSTSCTYYTMTIQELTEGEFIMFGITNKCVPGNPMWIIDRSVRYHSNDGGVFNGGLGIKTYNPYGIGDRITCKLDYTGPDRCLVNFLKNNRLVYRQWVNLPPGQLYPTIGVSRSEAKLRVEWPKEGKGDIEIKKDLPSNWFGWPGLQGNDDTKVVTLNELDTELEREAYNIQSPTVFSQNFSYFEIEILKQARGAKKDGYQAIGVVAGNCEPFLLPGWSLHSLGYHNDDGGLYCDGTDKTEQATSEKIAQEGDRMGCGIVFPSIDQSHFREPILVLVYFTKNGELMYKKRTRQPRGGFFPCVGFLTQGDSVKLDVDCKPPQEIQNDLVTALNLADATSDFRCSEIIDFKELAPDSAVFTLNMEEDSPQLVQYLRYPLSNVGDGFHLEVLDIKANTELQLGVSVSEHPMEGSFLGANATSCGYLLKLGSLAMKEGMRPVSKWSGTKDVISCYLDFIDEKMAILCFEKSSGEMIGRATISRADVSSPLYASVVMSAGPCTVRMNWSRSIYNTHNLDREWGEASQWLRSPGIKADQNKLTLQTDESYSFAACAQCRQPMLTGSNHFSIKLLGGESLPGIGLSKATTDVNNVLGSESGEVCFLPSTGELIMANNKWRLKDPPTFKKGDVLQCGMVFAEADREHQKGVVYFSLNNQEFFHCRFLMAHGGAYATVTLSSSGCSAEILQTSRLQPFPDSVTSEWLNSDSMEGVVPFSAADMMNKTDYEDKPFYHSEGELQVVESGHDERIVYVSHTIRERDRIDPFINLLRRQYLNIVFETSSNCVEISDKKEAIDKCEFIIVFMSDLYSESHEMAMEYSLMKDKRIVVAAHDSMTWPPQFYFKNDQKMQSYPGVRVSTVENKEHVDQLINLVDQQLGKNEKPQQADNRQKKQKAKMSNGNSPPSTHVNGHAHSDGSSNPKDAKKSSTCQIL